MKSILAAASFFMFICWAIIQANRGAESIFSDIVHLLPYGDKLGHALLFGMLALLMNLALNGRSILVRRWPLQLGSVLVLSFALIEELTQLYFPSRTFDLGDLLADVVGVMAFTLLSLRYTKKINLENSKP